MCVKPRPWVWLKVLRACGRLLYVGGVDDFKFLTASEGGWYQTKRHYHVDDVAMVLKAYHLIVYIYSQKNASSTIYSGKVHMVQ